MNEVEIRAPNYYDGVIALIAIAQVIFLVDNAALSVALATIVRDLHVNGNMVPWITSVHPLAYAGFLVLGGRGADRLGRRRLCIFGFLVFGVGLLFIALGTNVWMLIVARALEGFGSALFMPAIFSLINVLIPEGAPKSRALAVFGGVQGFAIMLGLAGGGWLTTAIGWRSAFLINIPLVIIAIFLAWRFIPKHLDTGDRRRIDFGGAFLITASAILVVSALSAMGKYGWTSSVGLGLLTGSFITFGLFLFLEKRVSDPLVPPALYSYPNFLGASIGSALMIAGAGCTLFLLTFFMQRLMHFTAMQSGFGMIPYSLALAVAGPIIHQGVSKYPLRRTVLIGISGFIFGIFLLCTFSIERGYILNIVPGSIISGMGVITSIVLLMALSTRAVPAALQGIASGVLITFQQIGLALGVSIGFTVITKATNSGASLSSAFRDGFLSALAIGVFGLIFVLAFTKKPAPVYVNASVAENV